MIQSHMTIYLMPIQPIQFNIFVLKSDYKLAAAITSKFLQTQVDNLIPCSVVNVLYQVPQAAGTWPVKTYLQFRHIICSRIIERKHQNALFVMAMGINALGIMGFGTMASERMALGILS